MYSDVQSLGNSFDQILVFSPDLTEKKTRLRSEFLEEEELVDDEDNEDKTNYKSSKSSSYRAMKLMTKRIKLLEVELRVMSYTQVKMQKDMEALIKKTVKRASRPIIKAIEKTTKVVEHATSATNKFEGIVNLPRA